MRKRNEVAKDIGTFSQTDKNYALFTLNNNILLLLEVLLDVREMLSSVNMFAETMQKRK